jgi:hypothetical protein
MKKNLLFLLSLIAVMYCSCKKDDAAGSSTNNQPDPSNHSPVANAGADQTIALPLNAVVLDGSESSDPDNNLSTYSWTQISGPSAGNIANANATRTQVNNLIIGVYQFELKITDMKGAFAKDTVAVMVTDVVTGAVTGADCNSNHWTRLQYLPADEFFFGPRYWFNGDNFLMGVDSTIYAVSNKGQLWKYNAQNNSWFFMCNFPENTSNTPVVFSVDGKGYCHINRHCWQYNTSANQWVKKTDPPDNLSNPFIINGKVYLKNMNNHIVEYDPVNDSYTVKNNCPGTEPLLGWFVVNGFGFHVYNNGQCWQYDAGTDKWQQMANLNVPGTLYNASSFAVGGSGYILGDLNLQAYNFNESMKLFRYDFASNEWSQCAKNNYPGDGAYQISAISFNGIAYVGLGYNNGDFNATDFWKFQ